MNPHSMIISGFWSGETKVQNRDRSRPSNLGRRKENQTGSKMYRRPRYISPTNHVPLCHPYHHPISSHAHQASFPHSPNPIPKPHHPHPITTTPFGKRRTINLLRIFTDRTKHEMRLVPVMMTGLVRRDLVAMFVPSLSCSISDIDESS